VSKRAGEVAKTRTTRVRSRCAERGSYRSLSDEVADQVEQARAAIVLAQIERAKAGSLAHAKWLWSQAAQSRMERQKPEEMSLARLLLDGLAEKH
jgi:hypothetical protein